MMVTTPRWSVGVIVGGSCVGGMSVGGIAVFVGRGVAVGSHANTLAVEDASNMIMNSTIMILFISLPVLFLTFPICPQITTHNGL
jgi:hypothetical protein